MSQTYTCTNSNTLYSNPHLYNYHHSAATPLQHVTAWIPELLRAGLQHQLVCASLPGHCKHHCQPHSKADPSLPQTNNPSTAPHATSRSNHPSHRHYMPSPVTADVSQQTSIPHTAHSPAAAPPTCCLCAQAQSPLLMSGAPAQPIMLHPRLAYAPLCKPGPASIYTTHIYRPHSSNSSAYNSFHRTAQAAPHGSAPNSSKKCDSAIIEHCLGQASAAGRMRTIPCSAITSW